MEEKHLYHFDHHEDGEGECGEDEEDRASCEDPREYSRALLTRWGEGVEE